MRGSTPVLLAIDTSTRTVGVALYDGHQVLSESVWTSSDHHTIELAPAITDLLAHSHVDIRSLCGIGVALGPGSFTGLRIGLALAKGIALVQHIPLIGIPTLDILAIAQEAMDIPMAAVLRAGRGKLAVGWYQLGADENENLTWQNNLTIEILTPMDLSQRIQSPTLICGELTEEERRLFIRKRKNVILASPASCLRRPSFLAELAWNRYLNGKLDDPGTITPHYLHYNDPIPG